MSTKAKGGRKTRYLIQDASKGMRPVVGGCLASSEEMANELAKEFGKHCYPVRYSDVRGSWEEGSSEIFWVRSSQYGQRYRCKVCLHEQLGTGQNRNHMRDCPFYVPAAPAPTQHTGRSAARVFLDLANKGGQDMSFNEWTSESARLRGRADVLDALGDALVPSTILAAFPELQRK